MPRLRLISLCLFIAASAFAQTNAVPYVNQLVPPSVAPGSGGFVLTVYGTGFAPDAVLSWNGSTRVTVVKSTDELQAVIQPNDVAKSGSAWVTVQNPVPGGGTSTPSFFNIRQSLPSVELPLQKGLSAQGPIAVGDFNGDGKLDVAVGQYSLTGGIVSIYLGNGNGTFQAPVTSTTTLGIGNLMAGDFNGDGKLDLAVGYAFDSGGSLYGDSYILIGAGDGTVTQLPTIYPWITVQAVGDWNGDGKLDLLGVETDGDNGFWSAAFLGNGDGTLTKSENNLGNNFASGSVAIGDFNGDGFVDLAIKPYGVALGNGDGAFQPIVYYSTTYSGQSIATADVNNDGKLDIITGGNSFGEGISLLLGNGDGTFALGQSLSIGSLYPFSMTVGDFNGDGKPDILVGEGYNPGTLAVFLGNGDGTFQSALDFLLNIFIYPDTIVYAADFNADGKLDVAVGGEFSPATVVLQELVALTPGNLVFGNQSVGTSSVPQTATLTNIGTSSFVINNITLAGPNANQFTQTNNCGVSIAANSSCSIQIAFAPTLVRPDTARLNVSVQGQGGTQDIILSGTGVPGPRLSLTPRSVVFPLQLVGTKSAPQIATLTNVGTQPSNISSIATTAAFTETNNCPATLATGLSCQITLQFVPTLPGRDTGTLTITDNASFSPQISDLSGTATVVQLSATGVNFGDQKVGTTSAAVPINVTNTARTTLSVSSITITGADASDFSETNNCGTNLAAGASCTVKITFTPSALGSRSGTLNINDNGGGSPQTAGLVGTGS